MTHEEVQAVLDEEIEYDGYKRGVLKAAFSKVANKKNWKYPIDAVIDEEDRQVVESAIVFFVGSVASFTPVGNGRLRVRARGYYADIGS